MSVFICVSGNCRAVLRHAIGAPATGHFPRLVMFTFVLGHAWYAKWGMGMARGCAEHYYAVVGRDFPQSKGRHGD